MSQEYLRYPTIYHDSIVFVAEDDLWLIKSSGGQAERLAAGVAEVKTPRFSPDGKQLAFVSQFEGPEEVYLFPQVGAEAQHLTFLSGTCAVVGWVPAGEALVFASNAGQCAWKAQALSTLNHQGGLPKLLPYGLSVMDQQEQWSLAAISGSQRIGNAIVVEELGNSGATCTGMGSFNA